jgi:FAD/FMN-containing dehydrogenase
VCGAGTILQTVQEAAVAAGCRFPLSLGARGSATIGGLVSTNAGGTQVLRHGTMRALVLGLEAVLPDGSVLDQLRPLRKDNSGYDLKQLLIGAEGTLGIVTRVARKLAPAMADRATGWAGMADADRALDLLGRLRAALGERVESFELVDRAALELVAGHAPGARLPLGAPSAFSCLIEAECADGALEAALVAAIEADVVEDALVARSGGQADALWALRETIPEAERREGGALKNDLAVAVEDVPAFHAAALALLAEHAPGARPLVFGHLGDGNLHWNVRPPEGEDGARWLAGAGEALRARLHDLVMAFGGSISAEHGIGLVKAAELARLADPARLAAMHAIRAALDPLGIMNPGKVLTAGAG